MEVIMSRGTIGVLTGIITLVIGGTAYTISNQDLINNFSNETGMSQDAAEQYVSNIPDDQIVSFDVLGTDMIADGQEILNAIETIDCENYIYDWEGTTLSCDEGKSQLQKFATSEINLGMAYRTLGSESAGEEDILAVINQVDIYNNNYNLEIIQKLVDYADIDEAIKTNLYNKSLLKTILESN